MKNFISSENLFNCSYNEVKIKKNSTDLCSSMGIDVDINHVNIC